MGPMTSVKGQSMSDSLLKTGRMLRRLEHVEETRKLCLGQTVLTMSRMAYEYVLGVSVPLPL